MLKVNPSMRLKKRYLLIEAKNKETIEKVILEYLGILGYAKAVPFFVEGERSDDKIILAVERKSLDDVRAAFEISKENIKITKVSGTIEGLRK